MVEEKDREDIEKLVALDGDTNALDSIRIGRIIMPILIGVGVVGYLLFDSFDTREFREIIASADVNTLFWIGVAIVILIVRHLAYSNRLRVLSDGEFSWSKCIELIFIWEFSSAVSPTSVGGSAVAFFVLAQEKLSTAKTATIVLYTVVLDTLFFIVSLPLLWLMFGNEMIRPYNENGGMLDAWGYAFLFAYGLMAVYGTVFYWGLFRSPRQIKHLLRRITGISILGRYREDALSLGDEMIVASKELRRHPIGYHLQAFLSTAVAWSCRFLLLNALIIAFTDVSLDFFIQSKLFARLETMFVIIAFSPTPGGAGFVEVLFDGFLADYMQSSTYSTTISTLWRLLTYYSYLIIGAVIIPNWIRNRLRNRRKRRDQSK